MTILTAALLVLAQNYAGDIRRQINRRSVALAMLPKNEDEGKNVAWGAESDGAVAETFLEGADVTNFGSDAQAPAVLPWSFYRTNFAVTNFAQAASRTSRTPEGNIELIARNMINSAMTLADKLNKALFTGQSGQTPGQIVGFAESIGLANNTYAGIDRTVVGNEYWRPYVVDPGSATPLTFDQVRGDLAAIYKAGGTRPNLAMVGPTTLTKVGALFDPLKFYNIATAQERAATMLKSRNIDYDGSTGALMFDGCMFVEDKDCPEGLIHYVDTEAVSIQYLPLSEPNPFNGDSVAEQLTDGYEAIPLGLRYTGLARTGSADKATGEVIVQARVLRPNRCGTRKNVKIT